MKISHRIDGRLGNVLSEVFLLFWFCRQCGIDFSDVVLNRDKRTFGDEEDPARREFFSFSIAKHADFFSNLSGNLVSGEEFARAFAGARRETFQVFRRRPLDLSGDILVTGFCPIRFGVDIFADPDALSLYRSLFFSEEFVGRVAAGSDYSGRTLGLSVRRGDFLTHPGGRFRQYVKTAGDYAGRFSPADFDRVVVFSDDLEWCRRSFGGLGGNVVFHENVSAPYDLVALSRCGRIIANAASTFSVHAKIFQAIFYGKPDCELI